MDKTSINRQMMDFPCHVLPILNTEEYAVFHGVPLDGWNPKRSKVAVSENDDVFIIYIYYNVICTIIVTVIINDYYYISYYYCLLIFTQTPNHTTKKQV